MEAVAQVRGLYVLEDKQDRCQGPSEDNGKGRGWSVSTSDLWVAQEEPVPNPIMRVTLWFFFSP